MNEPYLRLQYARRKAGFETASDAARAFGWNENTYRSHENGERGLRPGTAARYAKAFKVSSSWLLLGAEESGTLDRSFDNNDPFLILRDEGILTQLDNGIRYFLDASVIKTSHQHRYTIVETDRYSPRFRIGDLILSTNWSENNMIVGDIILFRIKDGSFHFGEFTSFRGEAISMTFNGELIPTSEIIELDVVMAVLKRSFYEVRIDVPSS